MYLVTGATGNVGSEVVTQLLAAGKPVRVFTRDGNKVSEWKDRVEVSVGDFSQPETLSRAAEGTEGTFLMNGGPDGEPFRNIVNALKTSGTPRVAFLSTILVKNPRIAIGQIHKNKEDILHDSGLPATFLRPAGFMSNVYQWRTSIQNEGAVYNSLGLGRSPAVAPEDIAAIAAKALLNAETPQHAYEITGGELLTVPDQVSVLAEVLGKSIRIVEAPVEAAVHSLIRSGVPPHIAASVGQSYEAVRK